jgi:hypothetical protein
MAGMLAKPTFALEITGSEAENTMRKNVFAAAVGIQDATLSNLAQPLCLVRIALKLLMLLRAHRTAHAGPGAYVPPDGAAHDHWMTNEQDLLDAVAEIDAELNTHYVKDKIDGGVANAPKRAHKRRMLLQKVSSIMRDGLLQAIRGKTLLSHLENKEYVTEEIENLNIITTAQATRLVSLTCVRLIIDIFSVMAKRGGSGKSTFQDLCALPDPSKDSWTTFERRLLEAKSHLLALRPADAEAVTNLMIAMQLHAFIKQGTLLPDEKYREAYRLVLDGMEQELDAPGQVGPLSLAKMKEVGAQLQVTLQSRSLSEVPPKIAAANKQISLEARVRRLEAGGGGKPPDKPPPDKTTSSAFGFPRGGGRGKGRGRGKSGRAAGQESTAPTGKCFVCGKVGCKPSTCPNGNPDAQKEHAAKQAERARANANRQVRRLQGACNVSEDEAVSDEENAQDKVFSTRFHYKIKRKQGQFEKCKVRLVVQGQHMHRKDDQGRGDFEDAFSPVPHASGFRTILALATQNNMHCDHVDISQAFVQGDLLPGDGHNGKVYISAPPGFDEDPNYVYQLRRPLYGMPSAARAWHHTMSAYLKGQGCTLVGFERSMWTVVKNGYVILITAHIDDFIIACADRQVLDEFRTALLQRFEGTYEGEVHTYLGCEILRELDAGKTLLSQKHYAEDVLRTYDYWECIPALTPMVPGARLTKEQCDPHPEPAFHRRYRGIVGSLGYLVNMTRPDLAWSYSELSKYVQNPGKAHMDAAHHVLRYLRATYDQAIVYERTNEMANTIWGWVDSDWAADLDSRRSHTGYILMLTGGAVSWKSRRQDCVSLSTSEAEYVAASQCGQEVIYLREILRDFGFPPTGPTRVYEDNLACVSMSENPVRRKYSRHIDIRRYFVRDLVAQQILKLVPLRTNLMVADALTKSLPAPAHAKHRDVMIGRVPFCVRTLRSSHCVRGG